MENTIITPERIEIILPDKKFSKRNSPSWQEDYLIPVSRRQRLFWPPFLVDFYLRTDLETIITHVAGDSSFYGNPYAGHYIMKGLRPWFRNHTELRVGSILEATKLEELLYELRILQV